MANKTKVEELKSPVKNDLSPCTLWSLGSQRSHQEQPMPGRPQWSTLEVRALLPFAS